MNGDVLTTIDYEDLVAFHREQGNAITIATRERSIKIDYGLLHLDGDSRVREYEEKPTITSRVSMGIYVMEPEAVDFVPEGDYFDFPDLVRVLLDQVSRSARTTTPASGSTSAGRRTTSARSTSGSRTRNKRTATATPTGEATGTSTATGTSRGTEMQSRTEHWLTTRTEQLRTRPMEMAPLTHARRRRAGSRGCDASARRMKP